MMQKATIGRIVHYRLTHDDASAINRRRLDAYTNGRGQNTGYVLHVGNDVGGGDRFPAIVVRENDGVHPNLQVFLDGNDVLWKTSVTPKGEDDDDQAPGSWAWPVVQNRFPATENNPEGTR